MPESAELELQSNSTIASGVGSMPGVSAAEASRVVSGELPDLPFLPELPDRGPGGEMIGRTMGLVSGLAADLSVEPIPTGWRLVGSPTRTTRLAQSWLDEDLDRVEEQYGASPGRFKIQIAGPWTLAAALETTGSGLALADSGLVAELGQALASVAASLLADVSRRLSGRRLILQVDEPSIGSVLAGRIRTASGFGRYEPVPTPVVAQLLGRIVEAVGGADSAGTGNTAGSVLHSCGDFPFDVSHSAGFSGISLDLLSLRRVRSVPGPQRAERLEVLESDLARQIESGVTCYAGVIPTTPVLDDPPTGLADRAEHEIAQLWSRTGLADARMRDLVITPTCGLGASSWPQARAALTACREVARRLNES